MPVLTAKILKEILVSFMINLMIMSLVAVLPVVNKFCKDISVLAVFSLIPWVLICVCKFTFPLATIITCTMFSSRYKADKQYIAAVSCSIPLKGIMRPIVAFFLVVAALYAALTHSIIPYAWRQFFLEIEKKGAEFLVHEAGKGMPVTLSPNERLFVSHVEPTLDGNNILKDITYTKVINDSRVEVVSAEKAIIESDNGDYSITCENFRVDSINTNNSKATSQDSNFDNKVTLRENKRTFDLAYKKRDRNKKRMEWTVGSDDLHTNNFEGNRLKNKEYSQIKDLIEQNIRHSKIIRKTFLTKREDVKKLKAMFAKDLSNEKNVEEIKAFLNEIKQKNFATHLKVEFNNRWIDAILLPVLASVGLWLGLYLPWAHKATALVTALLPFGLIYFPTLMYLHNNIIMKNWPVWSLWSVLVMTALPGAVFYQLSKKYGYH